MWDVLVAGTMALSLDTRTGQTEVLMVRLSPGALLRRAPTLPDGMIFRRTLFSPVLLCPWCSTGFEKRQEAILQKA